MNRPEPPTLAIPDVQSAGDARQMPIDQVGIRGLRYPMLFADGGGEAQPTIAICNVYVALPHDRKGTHMSRLLSVIDEVRGPLTIAALPAMLDTLTARLDADGGRIELDFPWFTRKRAPVSGVESLMDYQVLLVAERAQQRTMLTITVMVPVTSLCPSSKAVAGYGAHSQRSHLTLTARVRAPIALAEFIAIAEDEASCGLYGILKRADEKYVTERAYDRPRFVEDLVRGVAARLAGDARIDGFRVEAENFESIHNHSAYARIERAL